MGKLLAEYQKKYEAAIACGVAKGDTYAIKPELWICIRYLSDHNVEPWEPTLEPLLRQLIREDPKLAEVVITGIEHVIAVAKDSPE